VGAGRVATTKHLPPKDSIKYHFTNQSPITAFVGIGVNRTRFFDETGVGALAGATVGGAPIGNVKIVPWVFGAAYVIKF